MTSAEREFDSEEARQIAIWVTRICDAFRAGEGVNLRAELERLPVEHREKGGEMLEAALEDERLLRGPTSADVDEALAPFANSLDGRFRIVSKIGKGGMGDVYLAQRTDPPQVVAIKQIHSTDGDPGLARRFRQEAEVLAEIRHAGIVGFHELGTIDGTPSIVMDYVNGPSLREVLSVAIEIARETREVAESAFEIASKIAAGTYVPVEDPDPLASDPRILSRWAESVTVIIHEVCVALSEVWKLKGLLHRDLKPDNILIDAATGRVVITDFGLSRLRQSGEETAEVRTRTYGSLPYLAPELILGRGSDESRRDVFAIGVTFFELLCLRRPFVGQDGQVRVSSNSLSLRALVPFLKPDLYRVIDRAIAWDHADRFDSAESLRVDLENAMMGRSLTFRPRGLFGRSVIYLRRNPVVLLSWSAIALLILAAWVRTVWLSIEAERVAASRFRDIEDTLRDEIRELTEAERRLQEIRDEVVEIETEYPWFSGLLPPGEIGRYMEHQSRLRELIGRVYFSLQNAEREIPRLARGDEGRSRETLIEGYRSIIDASSFASSQFVPTLATSLRRLEQRWDSMADGRVDGPVKVSLSTNPAGLQVSIVRDSSTSSNASGLSLAGGTQAIHCTTPIENIELPVGTYVLKIVTPWQAVARLPVHLEWWTAGTTISLPTISFPSAEDVHTHRLEGMTFLPGTKSVVGKEVPDLYMGPRRSLSFPPMFMSDEITYGEYQEFVTWRKRALTGNAAGSNSDEMNDESTHDLGYDDQGNPVDEIRIILPLDPRSTAEDRYIDLDRLDPKKAEKFRSLSVCYISPIAADSYASWLSRERGCEIQLPSLAELERAGRGADGRIFPWGNYPLDPASVRPEIDVSPFGVRGLAGSVRELTRSRGDATALRSSRFGCGSHANESIRHIGEAFLFDERGKEFAVGDRGTGFRLVVHLGPDLKPSPPKADSQ